MGPPWALAYFNPHRRPSMEIAKCLLGWPCSVLPTALPGPGKWERIGLSWASSVWVLEHEEVPLGRETWRMYKSRVLVLSRCYEVKGTTSVMFEASIALQAQCGPDWGCLWAEKTIPICMVARADTGSVCLASC